MNTWNKIEKLKELPIDRIIDIAGYRRNGDKMVVQRCKYSECDYGGGVKEMSLMMVRGEYSHGIACNGETVLWWKDVEVVKHPDDL
jgi:hypothetical protein